MVSQGSKHSMILPILIAAKITPAMAKILNKKPKYNALKALKNLADFLHNAIHKIQYLFLSQIFYTILHIQTLLIIP